MGQKRLLELLARVRRAADEVLPALGAATATTMTPATTKPSAAAAAAGRPTSVKHDSQNDGIVSIALEAGVFGFRERRSAGAGGGETKGSSPSSVAVVELGAGRGYLGAAAADALVRIYAEKRKDEDEVLPLKCCSLTLVDRRVRFRLVFSGGGRGPSRGGEKNEAERESNSLSFTLILFKLQAYRNKAERHYRSVVGSGSGSKDAAAAAAAAAAERRRSPPFELSRATVDLADALLSSLPGVDPSPSSPLTSHLTYAADAAASPAAALPKVALLGKHLCGPATDFALRAAVTQLRLSHAEGGEEDGGQGRVHSLSGLAIATCCHHCCCWSDFCGKAEFLNLGFTADEFEVVSQASAWATGGHGRQGKREEEEEEEEEEEKESQSDDEGGGSEQEEEEGREEADGGRGKKKGPEGLDPDRPAPPPPPPPSPPPPRCWQSRIPIVDRRASGDAAKRLLDGCRVRWLERRSRAAPAPEEGATKGGGGARPDSSSSSSSSSLLVVEARAYAPEGVTGENRLIVAVPRRG